eukprot:scpid61118/ scgid3775/ 
MNCVANILLMLALWQGSVASLMRQGNEMGSVGYIENLLSLIEEGEGRRLENALVAHPRLRVLDKDLDRIREYIKTDFVAQMFHEKIVEHGEEILKAPPVVRPPPGPSGILTTVRVALDRVYTMGLLYRLSQPANQTWLQRGWKELHAAVNFSDWNPSHFLDVAEMTHTVAIGYDWFYNDLTEEQGSLLEQALEVKGFQPALKGYKDKAFWSVYPDNWNNVCNGGMIVGMLAVADSKNCPSAQSVGQHALKALPTAMESYGPLGAWPEGVGYWAYATRYTIFAISSLETATGGDNGLSSWPGFNSTALFVVHATAPSLQFFNYADAGRYTITEGPTDTPSLYHLATRFNIPAAAYLQRLKLQRSGDATPEDLIAYTPAGSFEDLAKLPRCMMFPRQNVAIARSSWSDYGAAWLGIKAGLTHEGDPHGHLDVGSFVYEATGHRWAIDLGADSYALPEYFGSKRFTYYRLRNIGHNTLTFNEDNQATDANASLTAAINCHGTSDVGYMSIDTNLTSAYTPSNISYVYRQFSLDYVTKELQIYDRIGYGESKASTLTWALHTYANITIQNPSTTAQLSYGPDRLQVSIVNGSDHTICSGTTFSYAPIDLAPPQESTKGVNKLVIQAPAADCKMLTVSLKPVQF